MNTKNLSRILLTLLAAAMLFAACACAPKPQEKEPSQTTAEDIGQGETVFTLQIIQKDKTEKVYSVHTDSQTVGQALQENDLIAGTESEYGLMVETVCGETLDYNTDHMYWAFYIDGEYAMTGVDSTPAENGRTYRLEATAD